ncbi:MAG: hypothetical protein HRT77_17560 [Halioglobus sp.]|nr:hypothetical protein [Halioglobus sp.]
MGRHTSSGERFLAIVMVACCSLLAACSVKQSNCTTTPDLTVEVVKALYNDNVSALIAGASLRRFYPASQYPTTFPTRDDFLVAAMDIDPTDETLLQSLHVFCKSTEGVDPQTRKELCTQIPIHALAELRPDNGLYQAFLAVLSVEEGDNDGALEYMESAARSANFDEGFFRQALSFVPVIDKYLPGHRACSPVLASSIAAMNLPEYQGIIEVCKPRVTTDERWREACLDVSRNMEKHGKGLVTTQVGLGLHAVLLDQIQQTDEAQEVRMRGDENRNIASDYGHSAHGRKNSRETGLRFLTYAEQYGELEAMRRLSDRQ